MAENRQAQITKFIQDLSDLSNLTIQPAPIPEPGPGEVLCKILLAPINPTDVHQILGQRSIGAFTFPQVSGIEGQLSSHGLMPAAFKAFETLCCMMTAGWRSTLHGTLPFTLS